MQLTLRFIVNVFSELDISVTDSCESSSEFTKKCSALRWQKLPTSSLKAVLSSSSLIWSARELAEANSIEIKHQHAALDCLGKHKTWNHLRWQYIWNIDRGKSGPRNVFQNPICFLMIGFCSVWEMIFWRRKNNFVSYFQPGHIINPIMGIQMILCFQTTWQVST